MQVKYHIDTVISAPIDTLLNIVEAALYKAVFVLKDIIIHRHSNVVAAPALYTLDVLFRDKIIKMLLAVIALRQPASDINAVHITIKFSHIFYRPF